ncbi:uncharacterized protein V6R79_016361 [Siganus canaliculatus]
MEIKTRLCVFSFPVWKRRRFFSAAGENQGHAAQRRRRSASHDEAFIIQPQSFNQLVVGGARNEKLHPAPSLQGSCRFKLPPASELSLKRSTHRKSSADDDERRPTNSSTSTTPLTAHNVQIRHDLIRDPRPF